MAGYVTPCNFSGILYFARKTITIPSVFLRLFLLPKTSICFVMLTAVNLTVKAFNDGYKDSFILSSGETL